MTYDGPDLSFVDAEDFLRALGVDFTRSGHNLIFSCIGDEHRFGDRHPSARMHAGTTQWTCSGCGMRGNAIVFLRVLKGLTYSEALRVIEERYGSPTTAPIDGLEQEIKRIMAAPERYVDHRVPPSEEWIGCFAIDWHDTSRPAVRYMVGERGFDPDVLASWGVGFDLISGRVAIPVRDEHGQLVGFKGRCIDASQPKYLILGDTQRRPPRYGFDTYAKSEHVFGLHRAQGQDAVVVEGELNVIALDQYEIHNGVGVAGSEFSETQARLIISRFGSAIVYFDDDPAGRHGVERVVEALSPYMPVSVVQSAEGDAAELPVERVRELLSTAVSSLQLALASATGQS